MEKNVWQQMPKDSASNTEHDLEEAHKKQQLYGHLPTITKIIQFIRTRHSGHAGEVGMNFQMTYSCELPLHGRAKVGRPDRTYTQQLYADTGCSLENLTGTMDDIDGWQERVREIRARGLTWWWWYIKSRWTDSMEYLTLPTSIFIIYLS